MKRTAKVNGASSLIGLLRRMTSSRVLGGFIAGIGLALVVGCNGGPGPSGGAIDERAALFSAPARLQAHRERDAVPAQVLRIAGSQPLTLDPAFVRDSGSAQYAVELFSGLVKLDSDLNVIGDLAQSWEVSGDGSVYTFSLRPSLRFADGKALTAENVSYSISRALDPRTESEMALTYLGDIKGAEDFSRGLAGSIAGIRAEASETLEIRLEQPVAFFLYKLTYPVSFVVDSAEADEDGWYRSPNSSGPFTLARWITGDEIVLERNENYHSPAAISQVRIALIGGSEALLRYETGAIDISDIGGGNVERFRDSNDPLRADYMSAPQFSLFYLGFNTEEPPFDDVHVRRAFANAIDVKKIVRVSLRGNDAVANGILPKDFPGHDPARAGLGYDPIDARAELASSTYGSAEALPDIRMLISGSGLLLPAHVEAALFLIKENLGVEIAVQTIDWADFLDELYAPSGEFQIFSLGWSADYPDPHNFLDLMFHSESAENISHYSNPRVDVLLVSAREEMDPTARLELYDVAETIIVNDAPIIPIWFSVDHVLVRPTVRGFSRPPSIQEWMSSVWIAD